MKKIVAIVGVFAILASSCQSNSYEDLAVSSVQIVPQPQSIETTNNETMVISSGLTIVAVNEEEQKIANYLKDYLTEINWAVKVKEDVPSSNFIAIQQKSIGSDNPEAYVLSTTKEGVKIEAANGKGLFYAVQSLIQMLPLNGEAVKLPLIKINDEPRFVYRGMHLDVARHFFPVEFIKKYLDMMAFYKMNNFHWHLTEDQGWRIEIKQYPKLTEVGSMRKETMVEKNFNPYVGDGTPHGGFYTQEEVKEIVAYAMERQINVIPEIEMPGHSMAALAAYPELGCTPGPFEVGTIWGVYKDIYCPSEETFTFLENVLSEVIELFPGQYIHIGGDEAPKDRWKESAVAQAVIKREGLKDEFELQSYFIRRIEKFLISKGKKLIGWDEILEGGLAPEATVMSWRGEAGGIEAAEQGHDVIMTPNSIAYFDHYQAGPEGEPLAIGGFTTLQDVYDYEPIPEELSKENQKHVLGAQANVWTEYMKTSDHVEYMVFPRMLALSETVWTKPENKNWERFQKKLKYQYKLLDSKNINYHLAAPAGLKQGLTLSEEIEIELSVPYSDAKIFYTTDGSQPSENSIEYTAPFILNIAEKELQVKAVTVTSTGKSSPIVQGVYKKAELVESVNPLKVNNGLQTMLFKRNYSSVNQIEGRASSTFVSENVVLPTNQPNQFGLVFQGLINVPTDGIYIFYTTSDDGSVLNIDGQKVVDNDGPHGAQERMGEIALKAGYHNFLLKYFEAGGGETLSVAFQGPDIEKQAIPANMFKH